MIECHQCRVAQPVSPSCSACRTAFTLSDITDVAIRTLQQYRASAGTPGATQLRCDYLSSGYVTHRDITFSLAIKSCSEKGDMEGLLSAITAYLPRHQITI